MKYHKILLSIPPIGRVRGLDPYPQPPLGLASIASVLEHKIDVLPILDGDFCQDYLNSLKSVVKLEHPDVVGFSALTSSAGRVMESACAVKEIDPSILVVIGGPHATVLGEKTLARCPCVDIAVCGEGEGPIQEIVEGRNLDEIRGIVYRDSFAGIKRNSPRPFINDLDTLNYPAYHLLPNFPGGYKPHPPRGLLRGVWTSVLHSRGCPFNCAYCSRAASFGSVYRCNSSKYVVGLLRYLNTHFGISEVTFYDDVFTCNRTETMELCKAMLPQNLGFRLGWDCETRVDLVDPELLLAMKEAGCRMIAYGIEHGLWIKEIKGGRATIEQAEKAIRWTHEAGIQTIGYFMLGLPFENSETILKTIEFAKKLDVTWAQFSIMVPIPGSKLYEQMVGSNPGLDKEWDRLVYENLGRMDIPFCATKELSGADLVFWRRRAYREFYLRRRYILRQLFSIRNLKDLRVAIEGLKMFTHTAF
jgi:radical SAM superfamily enzyme YgiQ (UPF0313 family)